MNGHSQESLTVQGCEKYFQMSVPYHNPKSVKIIPVNIYRQSNGHARSAQPAGHKITLRFPRLFVYFCIRSYHVHNNYITYIVVMRPYLVDFGNLA